MPLFNPFVPQAGAGLRYADAETLAADESLVPRLTDTFDLGSPTHLYRKGWLSELDAVLFAENTISLLGGWFYVTKDQGTLGADVAAADLQVDFGKAMTPGHFVVLRASLKVEYLQVGSLVGGTVYNVTRDLDGTGANDWPAGTPFAVLGTAGDGRIELNAYDTPRVSVIEQGATYGSVSERVRIGDVNGWGPFATQKWGWAVGDYAGGKYAYYTPADGLVVRGTVRADAGYLGSLSIDGVLSIGTSGGVYQGTGSFASPTSGLKVWNVGGKGRLGAFDGGSERVRLGDLNGNWGYTAETWGLAIGEYASGRANLVQDTTNGVRMRQHSTVKFLLKPDGDIRVGSDVALPGSTQLSIFTTGQTYNGESVGEGDLLIGDNSAGKANILWNRSAGLLRLRAGQVSNIWVNTAGEIALRAGDFELFQTQIPTSYMVWHNDSEGGVIANIGAGRFYGADTYVNHLHIRARSRLYGADTYRGRLSLVTERDTAGNWGAYLDLQPANVLNNVTAEMGDHLGYIRVRDGVVHISSHANVAGGLNVGSAVGATAGQVRASSTLISTADGGSTYGLNVRSALNYGRTRMYSFQMDATSGPFSRCLGNFYSGMVLVRFHYFGYDAHRGGFALIGRDYSDGNRHPVVLFRSDSRETRVEFWYKYNTSNSYWYTIRVNQTWPSGTNTLFVTVETFGQAWDSLNITPFSGFTQMNEVMRTRFIGSGAGEVGFNGNMGFYGTTPIAKPVVTGSRGGNAALASLIGSLAGLGLITDSSSA